ncbi:MAG: GDYXXLXY domain-containing protein [Trichodesmium sp. MAG_R03]|nr:GDYXXLXY domain-containing protein [Trichodesmium sp. MAG_R03]
MKFYKPFSQSNLSTKNQDNAEEISLLINEKKSLTKQIPIWRFVLPLTLQLALILSVPAQAIYTHITGRTVILQTAPIDPYDFLRGYYQVLSYEISRQNNLSKLPGWHQFKLETSGRFSSNNQTNIYVILAAPTKIENSEIPRVWQPVAVSGKMPENLPDNQIAIQGKFDGWRVKYGLYKVENQWGGYSAPWHPGGDWVIGGRSNQNVVAIDVKSDDGGETLNGTMTYIGEGPIGFRATRTGKNNNYTVENQWGGSSVIVKNVE